MTLLDDFKKFVADAQSGTQYAKWAHDNSGELVRWSAYRDAILAGQRPSPPNMLTWHGKELVDAGILYLNAIPPQPEPQSADQVFQTLWDSTKVPEYSWASPQTVTSQADLISKLKAATPGTRLQVRGFAFSGRLEIPRGLKGPIWFDSDPTFELVAPAGVYGQGFWVVDCQKIYVTGFPRVHNCGNQALLDQGSQDCFFEIDARDCGGTGVLINKATTVPTRNVYKIKGGNNGLDLTLDPHIQKGTGNHFLNCWQLQDGTILVDIDDQPYGAGVETCWMTRTHVGVRAKSLSCDVNKLPPGPNGERQAGGNAWQPWDASGVGPHTDCVVDVISVGSCAQGVAGALSSTANVGNIVKLGRLGSHRLSPAWATLPGVVYQDVN